MKKIILSIISIFIAVSFTACSDDDNLNIRLHDVQDEVSIYADEVNGTISFYAPDAWSASISQTKAGSTEWILLDEISGLKGEVELQVSTFRNLTGEDRSAVITIFCGKTATPVTFMQKGIKKDGQSGFMEFPEFMTNDEKPATVEPTSFFIINEDWFGTRNSTITRFYMNGIVDYPAYANANPGQQLGITTQYAISWGNSLYMISKQAPRLVVADATTLLKEAVLDNLAGEDGRAACGVDANTLYISTSGSILVYNIERNEIVDKVTGINGGNDLYEGQVGDLVRSGDYVFAAIQGKGIAVIDCASHRFVKIIEGTGSKNSGVSVSRDGYVWAAGNPILKIDPYTLEVVQQLQLPSASCSGGQVGWGAWSPTSLCAGTQTNCIYWSESGYGICRYDIDKGLLSTNLFPANAYGVGRIEPVHDYYTKIDYTSSDCTASLYTMEGQRVYNATLNERYTFPSHPFYEDANAPAILVNQLYMEPNQESKFCLSDMVYDADDASTQIVKTLSFQNTNQSMVAYEVKNDTLYLQSNTLEGFTTFNMTVCSHGKETTKAGIQIIVKKEEALD